MLQIGNTLISLDLIYKKFSCDLALCKGNCCVYGDFGAPLERKEIRIIKSHLPDIIPFMSQRGVDTLNNSGFYTTDASGENVTNLVLGKECVFVSFEDGIAKCAIEKCNEKLNIGFPKPISCHLYPVRIQKLNSYTAVNFNEWQICTPALKNGNEFGIPVYRFLRNSLIRKFGREWYDELDLTAINLMKEKERTE